MDKNKLIQALRELDVDEVRIMDGDGIHHDIDSITSDGTAALLETGAEVEDDDEGDDAT